MMAGNWKMNTTVEDAVVLVERMLGELDKITGVTKVVCPPFVSLVTIRNLISGSSVDLGAQNMYFEAEGAFTGEISPQMLGGLCRYVILGHSERRQYFHEDDTLINRKVEAALRYGITPILCVGETLEEKEAGKTEEKIISQVRNDLTGIDTPSAFVIAYEPIWAIGTGKTATGSEANDSAAAIRTELRKMWNKECSDTIRILYGGSTNKRNIGQFISQTDIDGALVGGSSLKAEEFAEMVRQAQKRQQ
jgi:triosephosphate isomerase